MKMCRKGLHEVTPENAGLKVGQGYYGCLACFKEQQKKYRAENKKAINERAAEKRKNRKAWVQDYLVKTKGMALKFEKPLRRR